MNIKRNSNSHIYFKHKFALDWVYEKKKFTSPFRIKSFRSPSRASSWGSPYKTFNILVCHKRFLVYKIHVLLNIFIEDNLKAPIKWNRFYYVRTSNEIKLLIPIKTSQQKSEQFIEEIQIVKKQKIRNFTKKSNFHFFISQSDQVFKNYNM